MKRRRRAQTSPSEILCPWCGERFEITVDPSAGRSETWTTDCEICCQPIKVFVEWDDEPRVDAERDD